MFDVETMLGEIRRWVEIETPTEEGERVNLLMDHVESLLGGSGLPVQRVPGRQGFGDHLSVRSPWGGDGPGILVLSHLDTVHPLGTIERHLPFQIDGDRVFGPGIYDMKACAYLAFRALAGLIEADTPTPLPIRWLITSDEEIGSPTSKDLIIEAGRQAKYVLVTEPARDGGKCVTARKGTARYTISFRGRPAHSGSSHERGRSAIREMAKHILDLEALTDYDRGITTNVGMVQGGTSMNTVPEHASMVLDVRLPTPEAVDSLLKCIEGIKAYDEDVTISVAGGLDRPPYPKTEATKALFAHASRLAAEIGFALEDSTSGGGSDGNFLAADRPVLDGLGADGAGAHTLNEHILVSSLVPRARLLQRLMQTLE